MKVHLLTQPGYTKQAHLQQLLHCVDSLSAPCGPRNQPCVAKLRCLPNNRDKSIHYKAKIGLVQALQPAVIASANIGCITHLQSGSADVPVRHWVEILDEALALQLFKA